MKKSAILAILVVFVLSFAAIVVAEEGHDHDMHKGETEAAPKVFDDPQNVGTKATCPVTGDELTIDENTLHSEYNGKHVYFCCAGCKPQFDKEPEKYLKTE